MKETAEFVGVFKKVIEDGLTDGGLLVPRIHFVVKKVSSLLGVVDGIVQLVALQFVVFYQSVIGFLGE